MINKKKSFHLKNKIKIYSFYKKTIEIINILFS